MTRLLTTGRKGSPVPMDGSITVPPALGRTELLRGPLRPKLAGLRRTDRRRWPQVDTYRGPSWEANHQTA